MARHDIGEGKERVPVGGKGEPRRPVGAMERAEKFADTGDVKTLTDGVPDAPVDTGELTLPELPTLTEDEHKAIREIADKLPIEAREQFLAAINVIRKEAGKGEVRLRDADAAEQQILDAYQRLGTLKDVCNELGLPHHRVHYVVVRKFGAKPVAYRRSSFRATPRVLAFIREGHAAGVPLMALAPEMGREYGKTPTRETMERLAHEAGVVFAPPRLDPARLPEVIADVIALERKYGVSIATLAVRFYEYTRPTREAVRGATV